MLVLTNDLFGIIFDFCGLSLFVLDYAIAAGATNAAGAAAIAAGAATGAAAIAANAATITTIADISTTVDGCIAHMNVSIAIPRREIIAVGCRSFHLCFLTLPNDFDSPCTVNEIRLRN